MYHEFRAQLAQQDALSQAGVSSHTRAQIHDLLNSTWYQVRGQGNSLTNTAAGTRPGDSIADILFAYIMTRYITCVRQKFVDAQLHTSLDVTWIPPGPLQPGDLPPQDIIQACWVDDLVLMMRDSNPEVLLSKLTCATTIVQDVAVTFALTLNFGPDKTAALLSLRGRHSRATLNNLLSASSPPCLQVPCESMSHPLNLRIVPDYVYLGVLIDHTGHPAEEVKRRFLAVTATKKLLRKKVFQSPKLPTATRQQLFKSLVQSRILYAAGAWHNLNLHTLQSFVTQMIQQVRFVTPHVTPGPGVHNLDIVAHSGFEHPLITLATARFSLFDRISQTEMTELFAVLQSQTFSNSWFQCVLSDLGHVLQITDDDTFRAIHHANCPQQLAMQCLQQPKSLIKFGKRAIKAYKAYLKVWLTYLQFEADFASDAAALQVTWDQPALPATPHQPWTCTLCSVTFPAYKALCSHAYQKHNITHVAHRYCASNTCRGCLKVFDNRLQVIHHLKYFRTGCLLKLLLVTSPLTDDELQDALAESQQQQPTLKRQQRRVRHKYPVQQGHGPQLPWPWTRAPQLAQVDSREPCPMPSEVFENWMLDLITPCLDHDTAGVFTVLMQHPYHGQLAYHVIQWIQLALNLDTPTCETVQSHLTVQEAITMWQDSCLQPIDNPCMPDSSIHVVHNLAALQPASQQDCNTKHNPPEARARKIQEMWNGFNVPLQLSKRIHNESQKVYTVTPSVPVPPFSNPIYLYVFSGRRRHGDFQEHMERHLQVHQQQGHILLLDLALSDQHDVSNPQLVATIIGWLKQRAIAGVLIAPPCETWTQARFNVEFDSDPRPIRSAEAPLALPQLRASEVEQIGTANFLLYVGIRILFHAALTHTPAVMEHPAEPTLEDRPTIWKLPWIKMMFHTKIVRKVRILQAFYGSRSVKPTDLAYCNMDFFETKLAADRLPVEWHKLKTLQGRDGEGHWKTAEAKEYPSQLNSTLAESFIIAQSRRAAVASSQAPLPEDVQHAFQQLYAGDVDKHQQSMRPDYQKLHVRPRDLDDRT